MRNIIILTAVLSVLSFKAIFGQCNSIPDDLGLVTVKGGPNGKITLTANTTLTYDVGLFGTLLLEVPLSTTDASISGAESVGLQFVQLFNSEDAGLPAGKRYAFFASSVTINPITLFPNGIDVEIGTITTVPESNLSASTIVLTDILPPVNNGGTYAYYKTAVQVCNTNNFNDNLIADAPNQALPIVLSDFTAIRYKDVSGKLDWSTTSETNGSHFEIERSTDTKQWSIIGSVEAKGESSILRKYEFIDENVVRLRSYTSKYYYRINMFDLDGNSEYSDTRMISFMDLENNVNIFPNPGSDHFYINTSSANISDINIFDLSGKSLINRISITELDKSNYYVNCDNLVAGTYLIRVNDNVKKVIVVK